MSAAFLVAFSAFALLRSGFDLALFDLETKPLKSAMYSLFIFFMITDPKTTVKPRWAQCLIAVLVAVMEMILRLSENIHAPYYALTIVGPIAVALEIWHSSRQPTWAVTSKAPRPSAIRRSITGCPSMRTRAKP